MKFKADYLAALQTSATPAPSGKKRQRSPPAITTPALPAPKRQKKTQGPEDAESSKTGASRSNSGMAPPADDVEPGNPMAMETGDEAEATTEPPSRAPSEAITPPQELTRLRRRRPKPLPTYQPPVDASDDESEVSNRGMTPRQMARSVLEPEDRDTTTGVPANPIDDTAALSALQQDMATMLERMNSLEGTTKREIDNLRDELARTRDELKEVKAQVLPTSGAEVTLSGVDGQLPPPLDL